MPEHFAVIRPASRSYRLYFGDELLLETDRVLELEEHLGDRAFPAVPYFSPQAVAQLELSPSANESRCPLKGLASYFDFRGSQSAVWTYRHPNDSVASIADHLGFDATKGFRVEAVG